jgi:hypothetical protein
LSSADPVLGEVDLRRTGAALSRRELAERILALGDAIWHNNQAGAPVTRSLVAYDR